MSELKSGIITLEDLLNLEEILDVREENERRISKAVKKQNGG